MMRTIDDLYMDMKVVAFLQMIFGASISWPLFSDVSKAAYWANSIDLGYFYERRNRKS